MTEKQIDEAKAKMSIGKNGALRGLFYHKNGLPRFGLLSNDDILGKLKIRWDNSLEYAGLIHLLGANLHHLRKQARDYGQPWIDFQAQGKGKSVAFHGYENEDIDKIAANIKKYRSIAENLVRISEDTKKIGDQKIREIRKRLTA